MSPALAWIAACDAGSLEVEDVRRFDHGGRTYAIYHTLEGYFASDGYCTHERAHLAEGMVIDDVIECPRHQGRFVIATGKACAAPVCVDLKTHPVRLEGGKVLIGLEE